MIQVLFYVIARNTYAAFENSTFSLDNDLEPLRAGSDTQLPALLASADRPGELPSPSDTTKRVSGTALEVHTSFTWSLSKLQRREMPRYPENRQGGRLVTEMRLSCRLSQSRGKNGQISGGSWVRGRLQKGLDRGDLH